VASSEVAASGDQTVHRDSPSDSKATEGSAVCRFEQLKYVEQMPKPTMPERSLMGSLSEVEASPGVWSRFLGV
jgi:hypothetical protein